MADHHPVFLIPAFEPDAKLLEVANGLLNNEKQAKLIVVDDGSTRTARWIFDELGKNPDTCILRHAVNLGKGAALKTGFNEVLNRYPQALGVVTVDADGQHLSSDALQIAEAQISKPDSLILGVRKWRGQIPLRSRLGNQLTRLSFFLFTGLNLGDTQTGLRAVPQSFLKKLLRTRSTDYDFETDMLVEAVVDQIRIEQYPIQTVYIAGNRSSHFNPLTDSLRIYFVFLRFIFASLVAAAVDMIFFSLAFSFGISIFASSICGRLVSGSVNFSMGHKLVFRSKSHWFKEFFKYWLLVFVLMTVSNLLISNLHASLGWSVYLAKVFSEGLLFFASFSIQRIFVFTNAKK